MDAFAMLRFAFRAPLQMYPVRIFPIFIGPCGAHTRFGYCLVVRGAKNNHIRHKLYRIEWPNDGHRAHCSSYLTQSAFEILKSSTFP